MIFISSYWCWTGWHGSAGWFWCHATFMKHFYFFHAFLCFKPFLLCVLPPSSFHYFHPSVLYLARPWFKTMFPWPRGNFSTITVPCCPHGAVPSRNVTGLQLIYLYIQRLPIYFRPPSFFLYRSSLHVCFLEMQPLIELTYMGSRVV